MEAEVELHRRPTILVRSVTDSKTGEAVLTSERLLFFDEKFGSGAGGVIEDAITGWLQHRHEAGGPLLDIPLATITRVSRETKLFSKDRIRISTSAGDYLFSDGWKDWNGLLRHALISRHGRAVVDESPEAWQVVDA